MTNISLDLSNRLPSEQTDTIRRVMGTAAKLGFTRSFIVGAQARDLVLQYGYGLPVRRATNDIDFGIVLESWDEFDRIRNALILDEGFRPHATKRQRLLQKRGAIIDLVPFGNVEQPTGIIAWPPDFSMIMSTVGFQEAYAASIDVRIQDDLIVKVASLAGLALLKMIAWNDRRFERDAQDLGLIMNHYLDAGNDHRLYEDNADCADLLQENDFDYTKASARVLGRDVSVLLNDDSQLVIEAVLTEATDEKASDSLALAMVRNNANYHGDFDVAFEMLVMLQQGILETE